VNNKRYEAAFYQKLENEVDYTDVDNALSTLENMEKSPYGL